MGRPSAVIEAAPRRRAWSLVGPVRLAALLIAASLGIADIAVSMASSGGAPPDPAVGLASAAGDGSAPAPPPAGPPAPTSMGGSVWGGVRRVVEVRGACTRGPRGIAPAEVVHHGSSAAKVVALTFDDGWGGPNLEHILRMLRNAHVNATFFPIGRAIRHDPEAWRKIAAAGFPIGDHTFDHRELDGLCFAQQVAELRHARSIVEGDLGVAPLAVMRPPGGALDRVTQLAAASVGEQRVVLWDVDTRDWTGIGARQVAAAALAGGNGSIVVMHTDREATARALPSIIRGYRKRGFTFVTIGQLLGIPGAVPFG